jgi:hypothetical protein
MFSAFPEKTLMQLTPKEDRSELQALEKPSPVKSQWVRDKIQIQIERVVQVKWFIGHVGYGSSCRAPKKVPRSLSLYTVEISLSLSLLELASTSFISKLKINNSHHDAFA